MTRETTVDVSDLIWPLFVVDAERSQPIASLPGLQRYGTAELLDAVEDAVKAGIPAIALFPATESDLKTDDAAEAVNANNLICRSIESVKKRFGDSIGVIADVALDPYSSHGHDGLIADGQVLNDETIEVLCRQAIVQAAAGCDVIAPSDMMDGRVGSIRSALDEAGYENVMILSYAAKYASGFYGPFRDAVGSATNLGSADKQTYQQSPSQSDEAIQEVAMDLEEGADMVMVKPGMPYLDIIWRVKQQFGVPTYAYQVSGEYAMIAAAVAAGYLDRRAAVMESLMSFKRAGVDGVLTYFAPEAAAWIHQRGPGG